MKKTIFFLICVCAPFLASANKLNVQICATDYPKGDQVKWTSSDVFDGYHGNCKNNSYSHGPKYVVPTVEHRFVTPGDTSCKHIFSHNPSSVSVYAHYYYTKGTNGSVKITIGKIKEKNSTAYSYNCHVDDNSH